MKILGHTGRPAENPFPDAGQTLLLRAAVGEPDLARAAWNQWYRETDIDALDYNAHRLFPLLYRNLVALGIDCPDLPRLKGVYRHYWYANQLLLRDAKMALQALRESGIETMVLKGVALSAAYYRDGGTRPMDDVDVLVHPRDAASALRILRELGYVRHSPMPVEIELRTRHSTGLQSDSGRGLDLHWYALFESANDDDLWRDSVPLTVAGVPTRALCPSDQVFHVCVHGVQAPMRWLADAATVIRSSSDDFDWDHLVDRAIARRCTVALLDALIHLERQLAVGVPAAVIDRLGAARPSYAERLAHRVAVRPPSYGSLYASQWDRYRRLRAAGAPGVQPNFAAYMRDWWNLSSYTELVRMLAVTELVRMLGRSELARMLGRSELVRMLGRKPVQIARYGMSDPADPKPL